MFHLLQRFKAISSIVDRVLSPFFKISADESEVDFVVVYCEDFEGRAR